MACVSRRLARFTAAAALIPFPALAGEIQVPLDNAITLTLEKAASTVYLANPTVADITRIDDRHIFILGKSFGSTNLIALDAAGREMVNDPIIVTDRVVGEVTVQRGVARETMTCTPERCQQSAVPGDDATPPAQTASAPNFTAQTGQAATHSGNSTKAAEDTTRAADAK